MLEYLTRLEINRDLASPLPTLEWIRKKGEDYKNLSFEEYLEKYYSKTDNYTQEVWNKVMLKLVEPSYDENRHEEMAYNFGYSNVDKHDFQLQYLVLEELKVLNQLPEDIRKFIGFMAGVGFFNNYQIAPLDWLNSRNWVNPHGKEIEKKTILEILQSDYGSNYLKTILIQLPFWRR